MDFPVKYKQLWSDWGIRVLMLISLFIQIILIFLGRLRKTSTLKWIRMFVWISYLLADWVADFVLGQLGNAMNYSSSSNAIIALWAPFLILHLGGPDTITAYSMEDNELWPRHLFGLFYELIIAFYVIIRSLPNTRLLAPTILIFLVAIIKYAERIYSLYKASTVSFHSSIKPYGPSPQKSLLHNPFSISDMVDLYELNEAFGLYSICKPFFVDRNPFSPARDDLLSKYSLEDMTAKKIINVTGMKLSYAYDELYTKAAVNHSSVGYVLRALCSICILLAFSLFVLAPKDGFHKLDVAITYVRLMASIFLDTRATIMLMFSDWMIVTLLNVKKLRNFSKLLAGHILRIKRVWLKRKYWLGENLINICLNNSTLNKAPRRSMMDWIKEKLSSVQGTKSYLRYYDDYKTFTLHTLQSIQATEELQDIIITYAQRGILKYLESTEPTPLKNITRSLYGVDASFFEHISQLPFDQQVLVWHISTELCFHWKSKLHPLHPYQKTIVAEKNKPRSSNMEVCKYLSNYMMYIVLIRSEMMSNKGGTSSLLIGSTISILVRSICELVDNNRLSKSNAKVEELCREMLITPIKWSRVLCVPDLAQVLAYLMLLIRDEVRWDVLTTVWVDLLIQGAKNTKAITHVKQLSRGSELLTFIWLLIKRAMIPQILDSRSSKINNLMHVADEVLLKIKDHL